MEKIFMQCTDVLVAAIENHAQPRIYDWLVLSVSLISVILSSIAIRASIYVPKKIAQKQDKIALFEKRYKVYNEIVVINDFLKGYCEASSRGLINTIAYNYEDILKEQSEGVDTAEEMQNRKIYESLWLGEIRGNHYQNEKDVGAILKEQERIIGHFSFIFEDIISEEEQLCNRFWDIYRTMTQRCVMISGSEEVVLWGIMNDQTYLKEEYQKIDVSKIIKKMRMQLSI